MTRSVTVETSVDVYLDDVFDRMTEDEWAEALTDFAKADPKKYAAVLAKVGLQPVPVAAPDPLVEHVACVRATKRRVA